MLEKPFEILIRCKKCGCVSGTTAQGRVNFKAMHRKKCYGVKR
jgi:hypothetical protein